MTQDKKISIRVGLFIFISFLLLVGAILILGRKRNMFQQSIKIATVFSNVQGLRVGNNVRFTGIEVGAVSNIKILTDTSALVVLSIDKGAVPFIKKDSRTIIGSEGLMGSKIVMLLPGTPGSPAVEDGDEITSERSIEFDDIIKEIQISGEKISEVANNLIEITGKINRGDGIFGKLFTDSELTQEIDQTGKNIESLSRNLKEVTEKINAGEGLIGHILMDTTFAQKLDETSINVAIISSNIEKLSSRIKNGEGSLGQLFADTTSAKGFIRMSQDLEKAVNNLSEISQKMNDPSNALNQFIADSAFADTLKITFRNLNKGLTEITEASEAVQRSGIVRAFSKDKKKKP